MPGLVGFGLRIGMFSALEGGEPLEDRDALAGAHLHDRLLPRARAPAVLPRRLGLDLTLIVRTSTTCTSNSASTAWRICVLWASGCTRKV